MVSIRESLVSRLEGAHDQVQQDREDDRGEEGEDEAAGEEVDLGVDVAGLAEGVGRGGAGWGGALAVLADGVDDPHRADDGEHEAGAGAAVEDVVGDQAGDQGAADAGEHRLEDAHRVGPDQQQAREGADDQAAQGQQDDVADYADGVVATQGSG